MCDYGGQSPEAAQRDFAALPNPQALTGPLNWYRAMPLLKLWKLTGTRVQCPTL